MLVEQLDVRNPGDFGRVALRRQHERPSKNCEFAVDRPILRFFASTPGYVALHVLRRKVGGAEIAKERLEVIFQSAPKIIDRSSLGRLVVFNDILKELSESHAFRIEPVEFAGYNLSSAFL